MAKRKPARSTGRSRSVRPTRSGRAHLVFGRRNFVLLFGSLALIVVGYGLMALDNARGLDARGVHLSLHSHLSLTVAPNLLLSG